MPLRNHFKNFVFLKENIEHRCTDSFIESVESNFVRQLNFR